MLLVQRGLAPTREKAQSYIMAGEVWHGTTRLTKPGVRVPVDMELELRGGRRYVGRGALKLLDGLRVFGVAATSRTAVDVGASTGGFTQVLLEAGARHVYAIDVGHGQLDATLRGDPRVTVREGLNARLFDAHTVPEPFSLVVADLSFISLKLVLPAVLPHAQPEGGALAAEAIVLMKPQFEAGPREVGRGGIVRDPAVHQKLCDEFAGWCPAPGWQHVAHAPSPITGTEGNVEFLFHYRRRA